MAVDGHPVAPCDVGEDAREDALRAGGRRIGGVHARHTLPGDGRWMVYRSSGHCGLPRRASPGAGGGRTPCPLFVATAQKDGKAAEITFRRKSSEMQ
ncbi:hypothetical protein GCM10010336_72680 [Streptomyces goshikiensis]|nr:hypothetical protein GCM10010336_72680 [Streptomyces goshikiensis]